ncbi:hypothetical protein H1Z61_14600 [Bacillus aquiflavi]|uniref:Uncharacterized protein n=1 Tax=Bacillus aquiflavi TaxID=2672567 RepID=A0A6B3VX35_9BACI|nr:hypothetical protein [Bacillus aquiflavi]MBA4538330.1 hypothetical protein [Bacillus aquiflavi]NEY82649.1 hypothetical protein [Bacillus aquiflavi]UAC47511.1 hypothetical protein K6959_12585 [Bacillus aquiflavi]
MSFEMKPEIKATLKKIEFIDRYKEMSNRFNGNPDDSFENYEIEKVIEIINTLGYDASFDKKENFIKVGVVDNSPNYMIWFNIILEYGMTEFIWVVYHNNEVRLGSPWSVYSRLLIDPSERILEPVFRNYIELEEILKEAFLMYEDFKCELINLYNEQ